MAKDLSNIRLNAGASNNSAVLDLNKVTNLGTLYGLNTGNVTPIRTQGAQSSGFTGDINRLMGQYAGNQNAPYSNDAYAAIQSQIAKQSAQNAAEVTANYAAKAAQDFVNNMKENGNTGVPDADNGGSGAGPVSDATDYQSLLNALYEQQQANAKALNEQQQQNALDAYERNMAAMNDAYNTRLGLLGGNFDTTMGLLDSNYAQAQAQQRQSAEDALRQAYIDRMMGEKNLTQQLVANGISGGASESARAGLINAYGNNRNSIQRSLLDNLTALDGSYLTNAHNARQAYNDALASAAAEMANYQAQFSRDLENGNATSYSDMFNQMSNLDNTYLNRMGDIMANNQSYAQKLALADAEAQAAQQKAIANDWRVGATQDMINRGLATAEIAKNLTSLGLSAEEIAELMNKTGVTLE